MIWALNYQSYGLKVCFFFAFISEISPGNDGSIIAFDEVLRGIRWTDKNTIGK